MSFDAVVDEGPWTGGDAVTSSSDMQQQRSRHDDGAVLSDSFFNNEPSSTPSSFPWDDAENLRSRVSKDETEETAVSITSTTSTDDEVNRTVDEDDAKGIDNFDLEAELLESSREITLDADSDGNEKDAAEACGEDDLQRVLRTVSFDVDETASNNHDFEAKTEGNFSDMAASADDSHISSARVGSQSCETTDDVPSADGVIESNANVVGVVSIEEPAAPPPSVPKKKMKRPAKRRGETPASVSLTNTADAVAKSSGDHRYKIIMDASSIQGNRRVAEFWKELDRSCTFVPPDYDLVVGHNHVSPRSTVAKQVRYASMLSGAIPDDVFRMDGIDKPAELDPISSSNVATRISRIMEKQETTSKHTIDREFHLHSSEIASSAPTDQSLPTKSNSSDLHQSTTLEADSVPTTASFEAPDNNGASGSDGEAAHSVIRSSTEAAKSEIHKCRTRDIEESTEVPCKDEPSSLIRHWYKKGPTVSRTSLMTGVALVGSLILVATLQRRAMGRPAR